MNRKIPTSALEGRSLASATVLPVGVLWTTAVVATVVAPLVPASAASP